MRHGGRYLTSSGRGRGLLLLLLTVSVACEDGIPTRPDARADGSRDTATDRTADRPLDGLVVDAPPDASADAFLDAADALPDAPIDLATDVAVDLGGDVPVDAPPDTTSDLQPDLPTDQPVDQTIDLPADLRADTPADVGQEAGACVGPPVVIPPGTLQKSAFISISREVAIAHGCSRFDELDTPAVGPFTLTTPQRLVMFQAHNLAPTTYTAAVSAGCSFTQPPIAGGTRRCIHTVVDLTPGDYAILACETTDRYSYFLEPVPTTTATNTNCAGAIDLIAGHSEPRVVDGNDRYYTFTLNQPSAPQVIFGQMEGDEPSVSIRTDCGDPATEVFAGPAYFCLPWSSYWMNTTQLPAGTYSLIVSRISRGTKYFIGVDPNEP